jgi:predicted site-specific integrase-resolvase
LLRADDLGMDELYRIGRAARYLGLHPQTLRRWEREGRLVSHRYGARDDRHYHKAELDHVRGTGSPTRPAHRREALYLRISGRGDQASSLAAQETELRASTSGEIVAVYRDIGSGLSERRRGLARALVAAERGDYEILRVTHRDRLARFGTIWIEQLLARSGARLEILHPEPVESVLMADFMSLVSAFAGRLYGQRSAATRRRLLESALAQ